MEKKKFIFYFAMALTLLACGVFGGDADNSPGDDNAGAPESGGAVESGSEGSSASGDEGESQPGPKTIDLTNPALYPSAPNFTTQIILIDEGSMMDGSAIIRNMEINSIVQTQPTDKRSATISTKLSNQEQAAVLETSVIEGQTYTYSPDVGCFVFSSDPAQETFDDLFQIDETLINESSRVETGVQINGFVTDRYEITEANINPEDEDFETDFTFLNGSAYVARKGGFLTRLYMEGITYVTQSENFDPSAESQATYTFNYIPTEGELDISPPAGCADQLTGDLAYPMMDDAAQVSSLPGGLFYESSYTLEEVLEFYRTEMVAEGWTLTDESIIGSFASLTFTKDGKTVNVMPVQNGDIVAVTIGEE
jgi:hypothetical protein